MEKCVICQKSCVLLVWAYNKRSFLQCWLQSDGIYKDNMQVVDMSCNSLKMCLYVTLSTIEAFIVFLGRSFRPHLSKIAFTTSRYLRVWGRTLWKRKAQMSLQSLWNDRKYRGFQPNSRIIGEFEVSLVKSFYSNFANRYGWVHSFNKIPNNF